MREEVAPIDELHREEPLPLVFEQLAEAHEIHVLDVLERAELVLEAQERVGVELAQHLQGDAAPLLAVVGLVDDPRPPGAELAQDEEPLGAAEVLALEGGARRYRGHAPVYAGRITPADRPARSRPASPAARSWFRRATPASFRRRRS